MPETTDYGLPQVMPQSTAAQFDARATPAEFGAPIGQALSSVGSDLFHIARMEKRYADSEAASSVHTNLGSWTQNKLLNPDSGILTTPPKNRDDMHAATQQALSDFDAESDRQLSGLKNDHQRAMALRFVASQRVELEGHLLRYEKQNGDRFSLQDMKAGVTNLQRDAALFRDTPKQVDDGSQINRIDANIAEQHRRISETGTHLGWSTEQIELAQAQASSATHTAVMQSMLGDIHGGNEDARAARSYLDKYGSEMSPQAREHFETAIETATTRQTAMSMASGILYDDKGNFRSDSDIYVALSSKEMMDAELKNPKLGDNIRSVVRQHLADHKAATEAVRNQNFDIASQIIQSGGGDMTRLPPAMDAALRQDPKQYEALQKMADYQMKRTEPPRDSETFIALKHAILSGGTMTVHTQASTFPPKAAGVEDVPVSQVDMRQYFADVNPAQRAELLELQAKARGEMTRGDNSGESISRMFDTSLFNAGINKPPMFKSGGEINPDAKPYVELQRQFYQEIEANGGINKVGTVGARQILDRLTKEQVIKTASGEQKFRAFELPGQGYALHIQDVPADHASAIRREASARGMTLTNDQVVEWYNANKASGDARKSSGASKSPYQDTMTSVPFTMH